VDELFIRMWAQRYREVYKKNGELAARSWFSQFINDLDKPRVLAAIKEGPQ
jgi:hypothetical protein